MTEEKQSLKQYRISYGFYQTRSFVVEAKDENDAFTIAWEDHKTQEDGPDGDDIQVKEEVQ